LTRSQVLKVAGYREYLESLPDGIKYLVHNGGKYDGSTKHIELGLVKGKIIQPIYAFSEEARVIADSCSVKESLAYAELLKLIQFCQPDYLFYWEWPDQMMDPFAEHGVSIPQKSFLIERNNLEPIKINIHRFPAL